MVTIEQNRPEFVLFVVSEGSRAMAESAAEASELDAPLKCDYLEVSDPQNFVTSYDEIRRGAEEWLARHALDALEVRADITGGTKVMTAALALCGAERFQEFTYVGGKDRDRGGLGVVRPGAEDVVSTLGTFAAITAGSYTTRMDAVPIIHDRYDHRHVASQLPAEHHVPASLGVLDGVPQHVSQCLAHPHTVQVHVGEVSGRIERQFNLSGLGLRLPALRLCCEKVMDRARFEGERQLPVVGLGKPVQVRHQTAQSVHSWMMLSEALSGV